MKDVRIHITGDYICDWSISRPDYVSDGYFDRSDITQVHVQGGGAWYLEQLIKSVSCADLKGPHAAPGLPKVQVKADRKLEELERLDGLPTDNVRNIAHAYSLWTMDERESGAKGKEQKVWRVKQLLGSRPLGDKVVFTPNPSLEKRRADLLVLEDLNLGYAEDRNRAAWAEAFASLKEQGQIVLRHGTPGPERPFWKHILEQARGRQLTVVISAAALRARNAALTRASSWDQTLNDIEREFRDGGSSRDLGKAHRIVVHYGASAVAVFQGRDLQTFIFRPDQLEGTWEETHPGKVFGAGSILTATLVQHLVHPDSYPLFTAIAQALAAHRQAHLVGGGMDRKTLRVDLAYDLKASRKASEGPAPAAACVKPITQADLEAFRADKAAEKYPFVAALDGFRAAWNPEKQTVWRRKPAARDCHTCNGSRLLCNVTGPYREALISIAAEVVRRGIDEVLASVPKARYGDFVSVDRCEMENINELRRLILNYREDIHIRRPLCIAVFGAPGAGKSFAIKEISRQILGDKKPLEFNLSQMNRKTDALNQAFHQVRDASIRQEIPLVFWDEFDAEGMTWLASFLAPMQDGEFFDGSHKHPFGKAIFVFAGGTCECFDKFCRWPHVPAKRRGIRFDGEQCDICVPESKRDLSRMQDVKWDSNFQALKGPDFISRLRGYVDILGPNPRNPSDHTHVLRRATILRQGIERQHPELLNERVAQISPDIIEEFLRVREYKYGARSINAVLDMSSLAGEHKFTVSALPSRDILAMHVSDDFNLARGLPRDVTERLAIAGHAGWRAVKQKQGYGSGGRRKDDAAQGLTHPDLRAWDDLDARSKQENRDCVAGRMLILRRFGYKPTPTASGKPGRRLRPQRLEALADRFSGEEHLRWWSRRLVQGWVKGNSTEDYLQRHTDICRFSALTKESKALNVGIAKHTIRALEDCGYELKKTRHHTRV